MNLRTALSLAALTAALPVGCGGDAITVGGPPQASARPRPAATGTAAPAAEAEAPAEPAAPSLPTYGEEEFAEAATNRDPFRNYAAMFVPRAGATPVAVQREVRMESTPIEEMRLIAIISGVPNPSAMMLDAQGTGHTVRRGEYIGRAEFVSTGGAESIPITLNWRIDRITPTEVILTREDPSGPDRLALTRVIPLHPEGEEASPRSR